ncbi:M1 family metallopeptidase [Arcicella sp. LKC2W]|uniref:M1 family metallopeptidase n=1 Tax=Arcicella sp. LKC2W TaxID=2984198 RepID=UPI002B21F6DD|nr:M1 family metallopeptidase [Arcicella sp. LKC2W]MEA5459892.1 M1 family metallopeptidase [Arcicella sp. LKC2W]
MNQTLFHQTKKQNLLILLFVLCSFSPIFAQFSRQDSLRGTLSAVRSCYDVTFYDLKLKVIPTSQTIEGSNTIYYKATTDFKKMQVDLFANMQIETISQNDKPLKFTREGNATFIHFSDIQKKNKKYAIKIEYRGKPQIARNPPWDGGFTWKKDPNGKDWIVVSCEGTGASLWFPNKDHLSDEPDSVKITCAVPKGLMCVSNGNLRSSKELKNDAPASNNKSLNGVSFQPFMEYEWFVSYPINNYNISLNIADYANFKDVYTAQDGDKLELDYYVLKPNLEKAKAHFKQVKPMLACYEKLFGKYPFWKDGYALVETPYWGMEHQSAVAYGNNYRNNEYGFDFIIIHESGHEYFGNSLSCNDHAEMWIHESFTTYMEALYVECMQNYEKSIKYLEKQKAGIRNAEPMIGALGVNYPQPDSDIYYKGTWMLHTLRNVINDDKIWFETLKGLATKFRISNVTTEQVIQYFNEKTGMNLSPIFNMYLKTKQIPVLQYQINTKSDNTVEVRYRWKETTPTMPIKAGFGIQKYEVISPNTEWQTKIFPKVEGQEFKIATELFYIKTEKL